jgi:hypothetical protein
MTGPAVPVVAMHRDGLRGAGAEYVRTSLGFLPVVLLIRAYEYVAARSTHTMPSLGFGGWLRLLESDIALTLGVAVVFAIPVLGMALISNVGARRLHQLLLVITAIAAVTLSQYFSITLVLLVDGYSRHDDAVPRLLGALAGAVCDLCDCCLVHLAVVAVDPDYDASCGDNRRAGTARHALPGTTPFHAGRVRLRHGVQRRCQ